MFPLFHDSMTHGPTDGRTVGRTHLKRPEGVFESVSTDANKCYQCRAYVFQHITDFHFEYRFETKIPVYIRRYVGRFLSSQLLSQLFDL